MKDNELDPSFDVQKNLLHYILKLGIVLWEPVLQTLNFAHAADSGHLESLFKLWDKSFFNHWFGHIHGSITAEKVVYSEHADPYLFHYLFSCCGKKKNGFIDVVFDVKCCCW
ncbi:hypothetical protein F2P56_031112 [Juglans regia]|uniref:Uncharacterized protein n=1 Tax=Juglans regia TaxID=51240 RepID=A0A833WIC2_JUGRE|nr:hypothetical protein F2P56_031112 [Juglans regia]